MTHWILFAIFLSSPQGVTETYVTKDRCLEELQAMQILARKDFWSGVCANSQDQDDYVDVSTELGP